MIPVPIGGQALKGGAVHEKNLPAQKASEKKRARVYEENGYQKRPQGFG